MVKKNLFDDEDDGQNQLIQSKNQNKDTNSEQTNTDGKLRVNKQFAQAFEKRVQRQLIDKAKVRYGANYEEKMEEERRGGSDDESSDMEEDSEGELINEKVSEKFIKTLAKIRSKDPSIYKENKEFFKEKDFEGENDGTNLKKKEERLTYGDMIRKDALKQMENDNVSSGEEENQHFRGETIAEEQKRIKDEFKRAASKENKDTEDADGIFTQKKKTKEQIENEDKEYEKFLKKVENKKKKTKKGDENELEVLKNFWGNETKLDETDKFLRKYIMTKGWVDKDDFGLNEDFEEADLQQDDEADRYEAKYNFRYEEPDANQVTTFGRKVEGSLRQKESKRADQRKDRDERKKESKKQLEEEIKHVKAATKDAIMDRIHKIQQTAGSKKFKANIEKMLEDDFDDAAFTKQLNQQFDSDYYEEEDSHIEELENYEKDMKKTEKQEQKAEMAKLGLDKEDLKKIQKKIKKVKGTEGEEEENEDAMEKEEDEEDEWSDEEDDDEEEIQATYNPQEDKDNVLNPKSNVPIALKQVLNDKEVEAMKDNGKDGVQLWWYCDNCKKGIQPGQHHFDCLECTDYSLCKNCSEGKFHDHPLKKMIVPKGCEPPSDAEILELLKEYKVCKTCNIKLDEYCGYFQLSSNEDVVLCEECYDQQNYKAKNLYEYVEAQKVDLEEMALSDPSKLAKHVDDKEIQKLVDQYYSLDFEDVISGGIKTRFKYIDVKPESYGLSDEQLLFADTDALNRFVSIKKLAPYREDEGKVKSKLLKNKKFLMQVEKSAKINKKIVKKDTEKGLVTKEDLQVLKKKDKKKYLKQLEKQKEEKQQKKEQEEEKKNPKLVLEDLSQTEKVKVSKNRLKSYGI